MPVRQTFNHPVNEGAARITGIFLEGNLIYKIVEIVLPPKEPFEFIRIKENLLNRNEADKLIEQGRGIKETSKS